MVQLLSGHCDIDLVRMRCWDFNHRRTVRFGEARDGCFYVLVVTLAKFAFVVLEGKDGY